MWNLKVDKIVNENIVKVLCDFVLNKDFLSMAQKAWFIEEKDKLDIIKM